MTRPRPSEMKAMAVIALGVVATSAWFFVRELAIAGSAGFPLDDSWIHLVFARNIARGDFFAYNPHVPVAGTTSPLWSALLGVVFFVWPSPVIMPKVVGVLLNIALGISMWRFGEYLGLRRSPAVMAALLTVCATRIVWASLSGMEVSLYTLLSVMSMFLYLRYLEDHTWRKYSGWLVGGISVIARPELMLTVVFFVVHQIVLRIQRARVRGAYGGKKPREPFASDGVIGIGDLAIRSVVFLAAAAPFYMLNHWLSGGYLPVTYQAKTADAGAGGLLASGDYAELAQRFVISLAVATIDAVKWMWAQDNILLTAVMIAGLVTVAITLFRRHAYSERGSALLLLAIILLLFAPIRSVVTGRLDFGQWGRYAANLTPVMVLFSVVVVCGWIEHRVRTVNAARQLYGLSVVGCGAIVATYYAMLSTFGRGHQWPSMGVWYPAWLHQGSPAHVLLFVVIAAGIAGTGFLFLRRGFSIAIVQSIVLTQFFAITIVANLQAADEYAWNVRNIHDTQVLLGEWLQANLPHDAVYATNDIGVMAYYADGVRMVDLMGLVSPDIADVLQKSGSTDETAMWAVEHYPLRYIVCFDEWFPRFVPSGVRSGLLRRVKSVNIPNNITCGGPGISAMHVYAVDRGRLGQ